MADDENEITNEIKSPQCPFIDQCNNIASECGQLPKKEELGNCPQSRTAETQVLAMHDTEHSTVVEFSEDISTATLQVSGHVIVRGHLPTPKRDASGELQRNDNGDVQLVPSIGGTPISEARTVDEVVLALQDHLPHKHGRVLRALMKATRPLRWNEVTPLARFAETTGEVTADQVHGELNDGQCWYRVPTSCTHIADLSWSKFARLLNDRDADELLHTVRERGKHLDIAFDDDRTFDHERLCALMQELPAITEAEFEQIIDDFAAARLLIITETNSTRGCLLNHLTMAQAHARTKPALARCAPNGSARTEPTARHDVRATGEVKAGSKKREQSYRVQRQQLKEKNVKIRKIEAQNERKTELMELSMELNDVERTQHRKQMTELKTVNSGLRIALRDIADQINAVLDDPSISDADVRRAMEAVVTTADPEREQAYGHAKKGMTE